MPDAPRNLRVFARTPVSIFVSWDSPAAAGAAVLGYCVCYYDVSSSETLETQLNVTSNRCTLVELQKYHQYSVRVVAFSASGLGASTQEVYCRTLSDGLYLVSVLYFRLSHHHRCHHTKWSRLYFPSCLDLQIITTRFARVILSVDAKTPEPFEISSQNIHCIILWLYRGVQVVAGPSVRWCCWLGLLTFKTHYRVGEPTAAWQFVDIRQHRLFDNGWHWQYVSCGQWQPPLSGAPVNKWLSTTTRERRIPPDSESGGIPHLFGTSLSRHMGGAWRARHNNSNNNKVVIFWCSCSLMLHTWVLCYINASVGNTGKVREFNEELRVKNTSKSVAKSLHSGLARKWAG